MTIVGFDYHPSFQQNVFVDTEIGELKELRLEHREPADRFYRELASRVEKVRLGMQACGHAHCFERLLEQANIVDHSGNGRSATSARENSKDTALKSSCAAQRSDQEELRERVKRSRVQSPTLIPREIGPNVRAASPGDAKRKNVQ